MLSPNHLKFRIKSGFDKIHEDVKEFIFPVWEIDSEIILFINIIANRR